MRRSILVGALALACDRPAPPPTRPMIQPGPAFATKRELACETIDLLVQIHQAVALHDERALHALDQHGCGNVLEGGAVTVIEVLADGDIVRMRYYASVSSSKVGYMRAVALRNGEPPNVRK